METLVAMAIDLGCQLQEDERFHALMEAQKADVFVIIGTSLNVYPAASLLQYVPSHARVFLIDPKPALPQGNRDVRVIAKGASEGMRQLLDEL